MENSQTELYHYTSFFALEGILKEKILRLSNVKSMNDKSEMIHFVNMLKKSLKNELSEKSNEIEELFNSYKDKFASESAYALSFSCYRDDAAQWERYADYGRGVCIVFDWNKMDELIKDKAFLQNVFYVDDIKNHTLYAELSIYFAIGHTFDSKKNIDDIFKDIWRSSVVYKHKSFEREGEIRLCQLAFSENEPKYKPESWGVREYLELSLFSDNDDSISDGLIKEIIVGPKAIYADGVIEKYIIEMGLHNTKISYSECPLR
ncbi:MAG: DUF2971 domain-containing protein [Lachnospiraceae bacterium]|nr:DUF2971 domain-containing protein [Lachnospiraceae bacterium]